MRVIIFDVAHGFCAYIISDNGNVILIDCGHNDSTGFRPSAYLPASGCNGIEQLIISNYDEDHLSDLPRLREVLPISSLRCNRSLSMAEIAEIKGSYDNVSAGVRCAIEMQAKFSDFDSPLPEFQNVSITPFMNLYPDFTDTNNLSLACFIQHAGASILFPGDLEVEGWRALLHDSRFVSCLSDVDILVASHHGRENGYFPELFDFFRNLALIVISDETRHYNTQSVDYSRHITTGIPINNRYRRVLTTRNDGMIIIDTNEIGFSVSTTK